MWPPGANGTATVIGRSVKAGSGAISVTSSCASPRWMEREHGLKSCDAAADDHDATGLDVVGEGHDDRTIGWASHREMVDRVRRNHAPWFARERHMPAMTGAVSARMTSGQARSWLSASEVLPKNQRPTRPR